MRRLLGEMDRLGALFNRPAGLVCTRCAHPTVRRFSGTVRRFSDGTRYAGRRRFSACSARPRCLSSCQAWCPGASTSRHGTRCSRASSPRASPQPRTPASGALLRLRRSVHPWRVSCGGAALIATARPSVPHPPRPALRSAPQPPSPAPNSAPFRAPSVPSSPSPPAQAAHVPPQQV